MNRDACFQLGYILKAHGTRGEVVAFFDVDFPEAYEDLESVFLLQKGELIPFFIESLNLQQKGRFIIGFEEVETIEQAEALKGTELYLPLTALPKLPENQFYFHDIIGYDIVDTEAGKLGTVREIFAMPTQDLIAMEYQGREVLIPIRDEIVLRADAANKELHVTLPDGLLDVYMTDDKPDTADEE
jgi:16S rRNA processing protein RimM